MLITSLFYSKLYYGSEAWHLPERTTAQNKMLKFASANALRIATNEITIYHTHTEVHRMTNRALPDQMIQYKHALMMYRLFRKCTPDNEFMHLNFQANLNQRLQCHNFLKIQNYSVGNNILLNRMCSLNNTIDKSLMNGNYLTYKLNCKEIFLKNQLWTKHYWVPNKPPTITDKLCILLFHLFFISKILDSHNAITMIYLF